MFQLIQQATSRQQLPLPAGQLVLIGRDDHCDLRLRDPSASRVHCRVLAQEGRVFLKDAGSRWGTFVNGIRVSECELRSGDEIMIGESILHLESIGESHGATVERSFC